MMNRWIFIYIYCTDIVKFNLKPNPFVYILAQKVIHKI